VTEFDKVIPPGGAGKVTASLDTTHYRGPIAKTVAVRATDGTGAVVQLQLKAQIVATIDVWPNDAPFIRAIAGESKPTEVTVASAGGEVFDVVAVESDSAVDVVVRAAPDGPQPRRAGKPPAKVVAGGSDRYVVTIAAKPTLPVGRATPNVVLTTDHPKVKTIPLHPTVFVTAPPPAR
jgi:hypothetical protein